MPTNRHHIRPRSRIRPKQDPDADNVALWDAKFHESWHHAFHNMTVEEIHAFVDLVSTPGERFDAKRLHKLRKEIIEAHGGRYLTARPRRDG